MSDIAIKIEGLKKQYTLGAIGGHTLTADLNSWWAKVRGKEDPNTKIGEDVSQYGKKFYALNGIDLTINKGEAVGIIGSNGAGKSTLLKLLSRVTAPTEGKICINGRITSMLEVGTGFHPELTGRENIYMNGAILGMTKAEIDSKVEEIIDFSECRQFIDTPVKRYSSGMYVKLAFAVAAHLDSEIMIMDEVLAVGDVKFQQKCLGKMGDASQGEGKTILYVSHNMSTIRQLCTRCIVLDHGKVIFDGDVNKAINVYVQGQKGVLKTDFDFRDVKRPSIEHGVHFLIEHFTFKNVDTPIFTMADHATIEITWSADALMKRMRFMFIITKLDGEAIGYYETGDVCDAEPGKRYITTLDMDFRNLTEDDYYFYADIIALNEFGTHVGLDRPMEKIYFKVIRPKNYTDLVWDGAAIGNVEFNHLIVTDNMSKAE